MRPKLDPVELTKRFLGAEVTELGRTARRVVEHMSERKPISRDAGELADERATFGERLSDRVAEIGGSWGFIIAFAAVLFGWMFLNSEVFGRIGVAFDPYPFIFLNLLLSTLAAVQAPIIMMSQNRQSNKDRIAARLDYEVNLRAELEILRIHEKLDLAVIEKLDQIDTHYADLVARISRLDKGSTDA